MIKRLLGVAFFLILLAAIGFGVDAGHFLTSPLANAKSREIRVDKGASFIALSHRLVDANILATRRDARYLSWYARATGAASRIKAGDYQIPARQTPRALVKLLVSGNTRQYSLTLVEGWRFARIRKALAANDKLAHRLKGDSAAQVMAAIGHAGEKPEGRFMPETYRFPRGMTDTAFLQRAYNAMQAYVTKAWKNRAPDTVVDSPYQALVLASIVEKETAKPAERARIAGVFSRRLKKGMRLQSDPTVIYGMNNYDGDIRRSDLTHDTPYNTYTRAGLPPTPIAIPSRASIHAAVHPASGQALYFVARGDGSHVFSDTLAQHNKAVAKYQGGS